MPIESLPDGRVSAGLWCLKGNIPSYDFGAYCITLRTLNIKNLFFRYREPLHSNKFPQQIAWNRFRNLLIPLAELSGLRWVMVPEVSGEFAPRVTAYGHFCQMHEMTGGRVHMWEAPYKWGESNYVTITLRKSHAGWQPARDSNLPEWEKVREELQKRGKKVVVINDAEENCISVPDRMSLYAGADMNLGVNTGPMMLCHFSKAPYLTFKMIPETEPERSHIRENFEISKFPIGGQFPWAHAKQRMVWETDTAETILKHFDEVMGC
jgi:hypothetical protein